MALGMNKAELIEILKDWNPWGTEQQAGVPRPQYLSTLESLISGSRHVVVVTGARRAGKSFLMKQAAASIIRGGARKENILFVNLEDPRFTQLDLKLLDRIYEAYLQYVGPGGQTYVFLDEAQEIEGWERWVRATDELQKARIIVSGSNAHLLSRELGTLLTGRHLDLTVFPLSFREFLAFNGIVVRRELDLIGKRIEIQSLLRKYIESGSFPEVALAEQKKLILLNYFEDLVNKDLVRRFRIRKQPELRSLVKFYLSNVASPVTFTSAAKFLRMSADTVEKFSGYLEQAYLLFFLKRFAFKVRKQEKSPRKVYSIDTGLSNAVAFRFSENIGKLAENLVFLELKRRQVFSPELELYYWKDIQHREVDFLIKEGTKVRQLIQVCWNVADFKTKERETRSLVKAIDELKTKDALVITEEYEGEEDIRGHTIRFMPLWKWLLADA